MQAMGAVVQTTESIGNASYMLAFSAGALPEKNLEKNHRTFADRATELQLELFDTLDNRSFQFVENIINKLPRQRQREHIRKLYLREYHSVKNDGSIAFQAGNRQRAHANSWLRTLDSRLKKVFHQYKCDVSQFLAFADNEPSWQQDLLAQIQQSQQQIEQQQAQLQQALQQGDGQALIAGKQALQQSEQGLQKQSKSLRLATAQLHKRQLQKASLPFFLIPESKLKEIANQLAQAFSAQQFEFFNLLALRQTRAYSAQELNKLTEQCYAQCAQACLAVGFPAPYWSSFKAHQRKTEQAKQLFAETGKVQAVKPLKGEQIDIALNKLVCEKYWFRTMRQVQKRMVEHIAIACGEVRKQVGNYVSHSAFYEWRAQHKKNYEFLRNMIVENVQNQNEQIELFEMFLRSSSNPALRRNELMNRLRGIEEWAEECQHQALFLTLTAPSSFHATIHNGQQNKKWHGVSPRQTQQYLNKLWQQFRAILKKRAIGFYGMRVAEPHHDGTPHWHLLVYVKNNHVAEVVEQFKKKALELDGNEQGAKKHRCKVEYCDKTKGSATAYISKYISKNIDGFALDNEKSDENPELTLKDNAKRAKAWACLWGIRQFQFYGTAPISVWRELRRLLSGQADDELTEKVRAVADVGCFASYLDLQGGAMAERKDQPLKLSYCDSQPNKYGAIRKKIQGVLNALNLKQTLTRLKQWVIKRKPAGFAPTNERSEANPSARSAPRTCVSNCNLINRTEIIQKVNQLMIPLGFPLKTEQIDYLLSGNPLRLNKFISLEVKNNDVHVVTQGEPSTDFERATYGAVWNLAKLLGN